jgi:hypothetical protein
VFSRGSAWCGSEPETPAVATPSLTLTHDRVPAGSVVDATYKWVVAGDAHFDQDYRVFVHVKDLDGDQLWSDDHFPPTPTSQWKPGQTIEYTRTFFTPVYPYVGPAAIEIGMYAPGEKLRVPMAGTDTGHRSYKLTTFQLLAQAEGVQAIYQDGWHGVEGAAALVEWT